MIVVTTPTGSIGSKVVAELLAAGERVRVVARDPQKLGSDVRPKLDVVEGSSDDASVLQRALAGAHSLLHVVPPFSGTPDVTAYYLRFTSPVIAAMKQNGVTRIVTVSGIGRRSSAKAGVVSSALAKDVELERAGLHVRALWCPSFMENSLRNLEALGSQGVYFGPSRSDLKRPLVATRDIAAVATRLLRDRSWTGPGGVAVLGPEDVSLEDEAAIMSDVLGRPVRYQRVPAAGYKAQLMQYGASEAFAQGILEMHAAKDAGLDLTEPRSAENTTPTTFREWCTTVLKPALAQAAAK